MNAFAQNCTLLCEQHQAGEISASEAAARLILLHLHAKHGIQWLSGPRREGPQRTNGALLELLDGMGISTTTRRRDQLTGLRDVTELFRHFLFRGVVRDSHEGVLAWLEGRYPLTAIYEIPSPDEMLGLQCEGRRYVTLLLQADDQWLQRGRHADNCAFLLHDFEHAHKFFADPASHRGQRRFFLTLRESLPAFARWASDPQFIADFDYLKSDMNSHPVHLMKYLKAIVLTAEIRRTGNREPELNSFWREVFTSWQMPDSTLAAAMQLNHQELESDRLSLSHYFMEALPENRETISHAFV